MSTVTVTATPITIKNTLPPLIVALSGDTNALIRQIENEAAAFAEITADNFQAADALVSKAIKWDKAIEAERKRLKEPITAMVNALDEAAGEARAGLLAVKAALGKRVLDFTTAENARREQERLRLEEQRRQAEERRRKEAEQQAAPAPAAPVAVWDEPEPAPAPTPAFVPQVFAPTIEQQLAAAPIKSSSVVEKKIPKVEITDASLVPNEFAGVQLRVLDIKAIEKLAKSGAKIPGVTVTYVPITAAKG